MRQTGSDPTTPKTRRHVPVLAILVATLSVILICASAAAAKGMSNKALIDEALDLGEEFGVMVGEVDEETRDVLGLQRAEGVVVYEVIAGRPADLAGIRVKAVIKEIDKHEIRDLEDFGRALKEALKEDNFTVATYQPFDPIHPNPSGGLNFHFVRVEKN